MSNRLILHVNDILSISNLSALIDYNNDREIRGESFYTRTTLERFADEKFRVTDLPLSPGGEVSLVSVTTGEKVWFYMYELTYFFKVDKTADIIAEPTLMCEEAIDITPILDVATAAPERSEHFVLAKLQEESGELARAINQPERVDEAVSGEVADVILTVVDLLYLNLQNDPRFANVHPSDLRCITVDLINKQIAKKTSKWASAVL